MVLMTNPADLVKKTVMEQERCDILQDNCPNSELNCRNCAVFKSVFGK
jgi:hypothetical protein